ncbi:hypothetical protein [Dokdonella sp.]|nr:hypothetical protein [Dokdonella sp.]
MTRLLPCTTSATSGREIAYCSSLGAPARIAVNPPIGVLATPCASA